MKSGDILKLRMSPDQVERFQVFLMEESGLVFEGRRARELERSVAMRMIELGISDFDEYHRFLNSRPAGQEEFNQLVISLTVGETQFFRTPDQFAALRKYILPELIAREAVSKSLYLVSAGCATGEEPYSLCIILRELIPDFDRWNIKVTAFDINRDYLRAAREGIYGERKLRLVDPETRNRYFDRIAKNQWRTRDIFSKNIEWKHHNVASDNRSVVEQGRDIHLVMCRNVLIYFNQDTIARVIKSFHDILCPGGYLMLGYSESLFKLSESFQTIHTPEAFLYQKSESASPPRQLAGRDVPYERDELLSALGSKPHPWVDKPIRPQPSFPVRPRPEPSPEPGTKAGSLLPEPAGTKPQPPTPKTSKEGKNENRLWEEGLELFAEERFEEARSCFENILEINPRSSRAHLGLGFLYANMGADLESRRYAEEARKQDDLLPEIYFLLALLDERSGNLARAKENYQRVIMLRPDFAMAHFNLANLHLKLGKEKDARREFQNAVNILNQDRDNQSLRFSGGLSRQAVISFCEMQADELGGRKRRH